MKNNCCYLCDSRDIRRLHSGVRDRSDLDVMICNACGLRFLSSFDHIRDNFYQDSGMHINSEDSSIYEWLATTSADDERRFRHLEKDIRGRDVLDFGCGNGGFLLKAKTSASFCAGVEIEKKNYPFFLKKNISVVKSLDELGDKKFDVITLFHVIEHFKDPLLEIKKIHQYLKPSGKIVVETPNADDALLTIFKNASFADFTYWSCHLYLFNDFTMKELLKKLGCEIVCASSLQRYSLANHFGWLVYGKPGCENEVFLKFNRDDLNDCYQRMLFQEKVCDTLWFEFR